MSRVLASINGKEITEATVLKFLNDIGPQAALQFKSPEGIKRVVDELVNQEVIYLNALESGLDQEEAFISELENLKEGLLKQYALDRMLENVEISEGEILDFYNNNKVNFIKQESVKASHILVENLDQANEVLKEINEGLSFEEAARKYSTCPSKEDGGNLGEFTKGQMVPEFEDAAFTLDLEIVSEPVKSQFGYHIIKVLEKNPIGMYSFDEVKNSIGQQVLGEKQQEVYLDKTNELKDKYEIVKNI